MSLLINNVLKQVRGHLRKKDAAGRSVFRLLLHLLSTQIQGDQGRAFQTLQAFGAPTGTVYSVYFRALRELTSVVQGSEKVFKPSDAMVSEVMRISVSRQFPALTPVLAETELMTAVEPFPSVSAMWQAHEVYTTDNTPAINGETYFSFTSPGGHTTFSSSPPSSAPAQQTRSLNHSNQNHQGSQRNPFVMNVSTPPDTDPFTLSYNHWPLEHFDEVHMVSATFSTSDPPLWSPLLGANARATTLRAWRGTCLNCGGQDHSDNVAPTRGVLASFTRCGLAYGPIGLLVLNSSIFDPLFRLSDV